MPTKPGMIGEFLMRAGLIDSSGLDRAQRIQSETGVSLNGFASRLAATVQILAGATRRIPQLLKRFHYLV
jgi:hypothetical protein